MDHRDARYLNLFGVRVGALPASRHHLHGWHRELDERIARAAKAPGSARVNRAVEALARALEGSGVLRMYVEEMIDLVPHDRKVVTSVGQLLAHLDHITRMAPRWESDKARRNFFPMSALFAEMMMDPAGEAAFRYPPFNDAIRGILQEWCGYLNGPGSLDVLNEGPHGWLSPDARAYNQLDHFVVPDRKAPHWGWPSFNAFFHREIQPEVRPVAEPDDPRVVVSPNDGTLYRIARDVEESEQFWVKDEPYSLRDMLGGSALLDRFLHGDVFQSYLSGANYHRWHAPVDGVVRAAHRVEGLMFSNLVADISGIHSQAYYTAVNTRGLTFIEADDPGIGMVCCMPVGITEISSITLTAGRGDRVRKGDQLGYFSYGGSSVAVLFQPGAIERFTVEVPADPPQPGQGVIEVNAQIAVAKG